MAWGKALPFEVYLSTCHPKAKGFGEIAASQPTDVGVLCCREFLDSRDSRLPAPEVFSIGPGVRLGICVPEFSRSF